MTHHKPSYSSSILFSNENPTHPDRNYILSNSSASVSDLVIYMHKQFRVNTPANRFVCEEDFENIKTEMFKCAQNGKQHFLFICKTISHGEIDENNYERETRCVSMMRPTTKKQFPQVMLQLVQDFYYTNPSIKLSDFNDCKKFEKLLTLLDSEFATIFTCLNEETSENMMASNKVEIR